MKNVKTLFAIGTVIVFALISCSKGDTGATGPAGPAGPDSVTYSAWIDLDFVADTVNSAYVDTLLAPSITKGILDSGIILSYVNAQDPDGTYHVIPVSALSDIAIYDDFSIGKINIGAYSDYSGIPYRYVTIPGSVKTVTNGSVVKVKGYTISELKVMPYEQVKMVLAEPKN